MRRQTANLYMAQKRYQRKDATQGVRKAFDILFLSKRPSISICIPCPLSLPEWRTLNEWWLTVAGPSHAFGEYSLPVFDIEENDSMHKFVVCIVNSLQLQAIDSDLGLLLIHTEAGGLGMISIQLLMEPVAARRMLKSKSFCAYVLRLRVVTYS